MAHDVFISYSVKDKTTADAICATLEANGIRVWIAPRDVMPGSDWGESIIEAIEQSKVMILVFSTNSNSSPQIKREIERSVNKGVTVVPFRIDDILPSKTLEYFISTQHWLDAFTPPLEKHLDNLVSILRSIITKQGDGGAAPRLQPHPPEEDDAPARPEPPVAPSATPHKTITVKISTRKILVIALGLLIGVALAGGAVWAGPAGCATCVGAAASFGGGVCPTARATGAPGAAGLPHRRGTRQAGPPRGRGRPLARR